MATSAKAPIAVDAMGADLGTSEIIRAVSMLYNEHPRVGEIVLVGKERLLKRLIDKAGLASNRHIHIHHASEVIGMDEKPIQSIKRKRDSSLVRAIELVKEGQCKAVVSCGNTGSLMACGTIKLRPMPGVVKPALATVMPNRLQHFILIDAGANPDAKPENLVHNAILGSHYASIVLKRRNPRIGLLSIGQEETKGNERTLLAHALLGKVSPIINYTGLIEGFEVFSNRVDVVVCDGFTGNVLLKTCESLFLSLKDYLTEEIKKTPLRMAGAILSRRAYHNMKTQLNPDQYGGAPLLGLRGNILKAHGSSKKGAIMNAIRIASELVEREMNEATQDDIARANQLIKGDLQKLETTEEAN